MIRVRDLPQQIGMGYPRALLYCPHCQAEYSANRGDYFLLDPDYFMRCGCSRGRPGLQLVTKDTRYTAVHR